MVNDEQGILERIIDVYGESQKHQPFDQSVRTRISEMDGTQRLYFNTAYPGGRLSRLGKRILQKLTNPILGKQVEFNVAVRETLIQTVAAVTDLEQEVNQLTASLEQEVRQLTAKTFQSEEQRLTSSGLWFNEPIKFAFREDGTAYWDKTTERIVEKAFVLQALARQFEDVKISVLDVGAAESLLSYELASLGYDVTAMDIRPIALSHPSLKYVKGDIAKPVFGPESFDCVTALSMLEHVGLGWYGDETGPKLDVQAVQQLHRLLKPGGTLILTVPYGKKALTPVHRIYDREALQELVGAFQVKRAEYGVRRDNFTITTTLDEGEAADKAHDPVNYLPGAVAMLVCVKAGASA